MSKKLVAYFSATGTTRQAAEWLASAIGADLFEIRPAQPYTSADLDWTNKRSRSSLEMNNPACRPEIAAQCPNMAQYDTVFIGFPIWWYVAPSIINTFVERYDFSGKTLVPFAHSGWAEKALSRGKLERGQAGQRYVGAGPAQLGYGTVRGGPLYESGTDKENRPGICAVL